MSARKKQLCLLARNKGLMSDCEKMAKPNGFFSQKREERRILSSLAKQGESRDVTFPRHSH
jgi:hypothetical protein